MRYPNSFLKNGPLYVVILAALVFVTGFVQYNSDSHHFSIQHETFVAGDNQASLIGYTVADLENYGQRYLEAKYPGTSQLPRFVNVALGMIPVLLLPPNIFWSPAIILTFMLCGICGILLTGIISNRNMNCLKPTLSQ